MVMLSPQIDNPGYDREVSEHQSEQTSIIDLRSYAIRLWRQVVPASIVAALVLVGGAAWTMLSPTSYTATAVLVAQVPAAATDADAVQQSTLLPALVAADLAVAKGNPEVIQAVLAKHSEIEAGTLSTRVELKQTGLLLQFSAEGESAEAAAALANDYAEALSVVAEKNNQYRQPALAFSYSAASPADAVTAEPKSGKLPRAIISVALAGLLAVVTAAALDVRARYRASSAE